MSLLLAADAAYPFDYTRLPPDCRIVLGYCGEPGYTPHVWSRAEVDTVRGLGLEWRPIWTVPQRALNAAEGVGAADGMATVLPTLGIVPGGPVFLDVERSAWDADPGGATVCITAWRDRMAGHGWPTAVPYAPDGYSPAWVPDWTGVRPDTLPAGWWGWQYASDKMLGAPYDLSVFDPAIFDLDPNTIPGADMPLTTADADLIVTRLLDHNMDHFGYNAPLAVVIANTLTNATTASQHGVNLEALVKALPTVTGTTSPAATAAAIIAALGTTEAGLVAAAITAATHAGP